MFLTSPSNKISINLVTQWSYYQLDTLMSSKLSINLGIYSLITEFYVLLSSKILINLSTYSLIYQICDNSAIKYQHKRITIQTFI
jgi:hypothetical protein